MHSKEEVSYRFVDGRRHIVSGLSVTHHRILIIKLQNNVRWRFLRDFRTAINEDVFKDEGLVPGWAQSSVKNLRHLTLITERNTHIGVWNV